MLRLVVLVSGNGTNLKAIIDANKNGLINSKVISVISNKSGVGALDIAKENSIDATVIDKKGAEFNNILLDKLLSLKPDIIVLAGFMKILPPEIIDRFKNQIINIHPSLLPSFKGLDAQKQAIEYGAKVSGCTVHFVDSGVDTGPIIIQSAVYIEEDDTEKSLSDKIRVEEHKIYPKVISLLERGKVQIKDDKVKILTLTN